MPQAQTQGLLVLGTRVGSLKENGDIELLIQVENREKTVIQAIKARIQFFDGLGYGIGSASGTLARVPQGQLMELRAFGKLTKSTLFKTKLSLQIT